MAMIELSVRGHDELAQFSDDAAMVLNKPDGGWKALRCICIRPGAKPGAHSVRLTTSTYYPYRGEAPVARLLLGLVYGDPREADHRDGDPFNNTNTNIRAVSKAENQQNRCGVSNRQNATGIRNVHDYSDRVGTRYWHVQVNGGGRAIYNRYFRQGVITMQEAGELAQLQRIFHMTHSDGR